MQFVQFFIESKLVLISLLEHNCLIILPCLNEIGDSKGVKRSYWCHF